MRSKIAEDVQSALPVPPAGPGARLDRVAAATAEQLKTALILLSSFSPDAFDYVMDAAESGDAAPGAAEEACPRCAICGGSIGVFVDLGLDWRHFSGDGITAGRQRIYDPGHAPVATWGIPTDFETQS